MEGDTWRNAYSWRYSFIWRVRISVCIQCEFLTKPFCLCIQWSSLSKEEIRLAILKKKKKCTFASSHPDAYRRWHEKSKELGNHRYSSIWIFLSSRCNDLVMRPFLTIMVSWKTRFELALSHAGRWKPPYDVQWLSLDTIENTYKPYIDTSLFPTLVNVFESGMEPRIYWKSGNKHNIIHSFRGPKFP